MLRSIIMQIGIGMSQIPDVVEKLYKQYSDGKQEPGRRSLVETLQFLLASSNRMYLILDAVDECSERKEVFEVISNITQRTVGLLATSRKERDITEPLNA